ncbi:HNH endonuclease [Phage f2b1]|nr:HNH endonuclease [Phage f2b1]
MQYKTCTKCQKEKEANVDNFRLRKDKFNSQCRECEREYAKRHTAQNKEKRKAYDKKYREENKERIAARQKEYMKTYLPEYYEKNKDLLIDKQRQYRKENEEAVKANQRRYYEENKERIIERNRKWRAENRDKMAKLIKNWFKENKDKRREYNQTRRAKLQELVADLTVEQWETIQSYFGNCCAYCGEVEPLNQDHFIPVNSGGGYTLSNIIPACTPCNSSKHDNDFAEWYPRYRHYSKEREQFILDYLKQFDVKTLGS